MWLRHGELYGVLPLTSSGVRLPFSYPPIAAAALSPLSLMPMAVAGTLLTLASVALTAVVLRVFLRSGAGAGSWWMAGWLLPVALLLEPVRNTLNYGQINILLMALVAADCLLPDVRWPRGALVGLAAAVKLTPAAFVLFFLCRGDRRAAGTSALSFAACTAAGFALDWHDSVRYWTSIVLQTTRPGSLLFCANQSIQGVLARAGLDPHTRAGTATWLVLSAAVLVLAWCGMRRARAASDDAWALSLNALAALLISPISWSHHWVWAAPALLLLAVRGLRDRHRATLAAALAGLAVFAAGPQWWFPHTENREAHWAAWEQVIGGSYVILQVGDIRRHLRIAVPVIGRDAWRQADGLLARARPVRLGTGRCTRCLVPRRSAGRRLLAVWPGTGERGFGHCATPFEWTLSIRTLYRGGLTFGVSQSGCQQSFSALW